MTRVLASVALLAVAACGRLDEVDLTRSESVVVPGAPGGAALPGSAVQLALPLDRDALEQEGIDPDDVDSARLVGLRLEALSGSSFEGWLDAIVFHLVAPGLPRVLVAERSGIRALPAGTRTLELDMSGADLKPYVLSPDAALTAEVVGSQPGEETQVRATATLRVDVSVGGLVD